MKKQAGDRSEDWNARLLRPGLSSVPMTDVTTHGLSVDGTNRTHQEEGLAPRWPLLQGSPKEQAGTPAAGDASLVPLPRRRHLTSEGSQSRRRDELFRGPCEAAEGPARGTWGCWCPVGVKAGSCSGPVSTSPSIHSFPCSLSRPTWQSFPMDHVGQASIRRAACLLPRCGRA